MRLYVVGLTSAGLQVIGSDLSIGNWWVMGQVLRALTPSLASRNLYLNSANDSVKSLIHRKGEDPNFSPVG
jgi:hypothetical protein